ncbi:MAG: hypothetical protein Kow0074_04850 [Candidatus Zixiibacteriota bacterium]
MVLRQSLIICVLVTFLTSPALAVNSVLLDSKEVCVNQEDVTIGIYVANVVAVRHMIIPLEVRAGEGKATIKSVKIGWRGRLPTERNSALSDHIFNGLYFKKDCNCPTGGAGFGTLATTDLTESQEVPGLPFGILLSRLRFTGPDLMPGEDTTDASIFITMDVGPEPGEVILDTTCICPNHHLAFVHGVQDVQAVRPAFQMGVINVVECKDEE